MTHDVSLPINSTHYAMDTFEQCYAMLYPQNGDRILAIDSVTSPPYVDSGSSDVTVIYEHDTLAIL